MVAALGNIGKIPELRRRILFTIGMLAIYRLGVMVSTPGINVQKLRSMFEGGAEALFGLLNLFSGGALENFSIFTLGITPYISVSIIMQLLGPIVPALEQLKKEGDAGRRIITRYTRLATIGLALFQGWMFSYGLQRQGLTLVSGLQFQIVTAVTLTAGTAFMMWLGEQITEKGLGNGVSILIFAGIVARMPSVFAETVYKARVGEVQPAVVLFVLVFALATVATIVFVERSFRKIPVNYPRRMVGNALTQSQTQFMPLKVNMSGVIPPIFASALLVFLSYPLAFSTNEILQDIVSLLSPGAWGHELVYATLIIFFAFFYRTVVFNTEEVADNLKKNGGFIPMVRPGKPTAEYLDGVLSRLTLWGSLYITAICIIPNLVYHRLDLANFSMVFGGTAILIVVGVVIDTASQIESIVTARNYEAFMSKNSKLRGLKAASYGKTRLLRR